MERAAESPFYGLSGAVAQAYGVVLIGGDQAAFELATYRARHSAADAEPRVWVFCSM